MKNKRNWLILLIATMATGYFAIQNFAAPSDEKPVFPPTDVPASVTQKLTPLPAFSPSPTPTYEDCYYNWAQEDMPELTQKIDSAIRTLATDASGMATAFGEDCIYADGHSTFGAMETDFYIQLRVDDLHNEEVFGNWITQVMTVIEKIPPEEISGPQPGFVEFRFTKSDTEQIIFRVPIRDYRDKAGGKSGTELFRLFYTPPVNPT
jgi:hypothetical protein